MQNLEHLAQIREKLLGIEGVQADRHSAVNPATADSTTDEIRLIQAVDLHPEPIRWLWEGWLAAGKLHVLAGPAGTGKTTVALAMAATITGGGRWPDGTAALPGNVLVWSGEDDPKDTLVPRLIAMGANLNRVYFVDGTREGNEVRPFDPACDAGALTRTAHRIGDVRLLVVDPLVNAVAGDTHKNGEVRRGLQPLVDLAWTLDCAVIGITHFSKGTAGRDPTERVCGSVAFGALARVVMGAVKMTEDQGGGRLLVRTKSNIGPDGGGFRYDFIQTGLVEYPGVFASSILWGEQVEGEARDLLGQAALSSDPEDRNAT
ncbi:MAG: AAA family ATPase, partial [Methylococcaceae bacterium]|nr:AAA family ATPase [Methylococcaceae bacterium]